MSNTLKSFNQIFKETYADAIANLIPSRNYKDMSIDSLKEIDSDEARKWLKIKQSKLWGTLNES